VGVGEVVVVCVVAGSATAVLVSVAVVVGASVVVVGAVSVVVAGAGSEVVVVVVGVVAVDDVLVVVVVFEDLCVLDELTLAAANALAPPRARITRAMRSDKTRGIPHLSEGWQNPQPGHLTQVRLNASER
jgi:hypothetical protein